MADLRVSQVPIEVLWEDTTPATVRVSQGAIEVLASGNEARVSHAVVRTMSAITPTGRVSSVVVRTMSLSTPTALVSRLTVRTMSAYSPASLTGAKVWRDGLPVLVQ
jgi:hydroxyethylthiazole kinase-like sugar kinase family protein